MWAARAGNLEITKLLIEKGANAADTDNDGKHGEKPGEAYEGAE
jgi:ankyrin repeat protein